MEFKLQPLRIPGGWKIVFNKFYDIDPCSINDKNNEIWYFYFVQDILYIERKQEIKFNHKKYVHTLGIDLGWYPDGDSEGTFSLMLIVDNEWNNPLKKFESKNKFEIVDKLEKWLNEYLNYRDWKNL